MSELKIIIHIIPNFTFSLEIFCSLRINSYEFCEFLDANENKKRQKIIIDNIQHSLRFHNVNHDIQKGLLFPSFCLRVNKSLSYFQPA